MTGPADLLTAKALELATNMVNDPLAQRYLTRLTTSVAAHKPALSRVHTADDVLGERLVRLGMLIGMEHDQPGSVVSPKRPASTMLETLVTTAELGMTATPYLWTEEVRLGLRGLKLPRHVLSPRVLPQPRTWHTFETGIGLGGTLDVNGRHLEDGVLDAMLVCDAGTGLEVLYLGQMNDVETGEPVPTVTGGQLRYGTTYPDDFPDPDDGWRNLAEDVLTMFAFLASPYIPKQQARPSRAARREARRAGRPVDDELVTFVILRYPTDRRPEANDPRASVEWRHRWLVNGHLRAQWYPSEQAHHLIWIAPYLKGPEDAPMLEHAYKVAR